ncbi:cysteine--tRNA ligase [uncultured Rikenella sp.]|uniref:cysteine--tRNA ligase n=1 Tax=uncultured Rikenella sp. TaxID=368003 RepID=UPI002629EFD0|nr:cysteine--tRNA ligase [uncultured Rikenella sp.]
MAKPIYLYNTLTRRKEEFAPLHAPAVGMYVCGPTVYGDPHLGHVRPAVTFDLLFRLLRYEGYKVRYVRNITDVGHLENDADAGEDKIAKKARLEQLEPMEVAQYYTNRYHEFMDRLGVLRPSIEPHASGHIIEQIAMTQAILDAGYAYVSNGSVYFDVRKYVADGNNYGILSGRNLDDMQSGGRSEDYEGEKRFPADFALWKRAAPEHIMRWPSPWSEGFPGWHMECSAMGAKYLGETFDIHGGGMDLMFPHHECEIAQSTAALGHASARYWVHNNMVTIGGQKMGKSLGNFITLEQFFTGDHALLSQPYSPMVIRFFILQAHYRSTLDFSDEALQGAQKGLERLMKAWNLLASGRIAPAAASTIPSPSALLGECEEALCDDLNSPVAIARLFDWVRHVNALNDGTLTATEADLQTLHTAFDTVLGTLLGLSLSAEGGAAPAAGGNDRLGGVIDMILEVRQQAKAAKDWTTSDLIRDRLAALGIRIKDRKDGADWELD